MFGAIIGDIVGSKYEFHNIKTKEFELFSNESEYTDDTIMTCAVAKAILLSREDQFKPNVPIRTFHSYLMETMKDFGRRYPTPKGGYGQMFQQWIYEKESKPYNSFGNGSAMRVSPCGIIAITLDEAITLARASAIVTHDHPEGIKGAEAVSAAIFLAKAKESKEDIKKYIQEHYYDVSMKLEDIRLTYQFDPSCQNTVPQAIVCFLESESFEDAIRNAISIGGDSDTIGAITGAIAWAYYEGKDSDMDAIAEKARTYLPDEFLEIVESFNDRAWQRRTYFELVGNCKGVIGLEEYKLLHELEEKELPNEN